jgi:hypothetical protein
MFVLYYLWDEQINELLPFSKLVFLTINRVALLIFWAVIVHDIVFTMSYFFTISISEGSIEEVDDKKWRFLS